jgi:hypothetical protein
LLICAFSTARMCRASTQITGKPASAISAIHKPPADYPIFRKTAVADKPIWVPAHKKDST